MFQTVVFFNSSLKAVLFQNTSVIETGDTLFFIFLFKIRPNCKFFPKLEQTECLEGFPQVVEKNRHLSTVLLKITTAKSVQAIILLLETLVQDSTQQC